MKRKVRGQQTSRKPGTKRVRRWSTQHSGAFYTIPGRCQKSHTSKFLANVSIVVWWALRFAFLLYSLFDSVSFTSLFAMRSACILVGDLPQHVSCSNSLHVNCQYSVTKHLREWNKKKYPQGTERADPTPTRRLRYFLMLYMCRSHLVCE